MMAFMHTDLSETLMVSIDFTPEQLRAVSTACTTKFVGMVLSEKFSPIPLDAEERRIKDGLESALDLLGEGLRGIKAEEALDKGGAS